MYITNLRKVGGSVMLAVPTAFLEQLSLKAGGKVGVVIDEGRIIIKPTPRHRYTLDELLSASDYSSEPSPEEREWLDAPAVGDELL